MRFCTFQTGKKTTAGLIHGTYVLDLGQAFFRTFKRPYRFPDLLSFLEADGLSRLPELDLAALQRDRSCAHTLRDVTLRAPILRPPKIICVGLNYRSHAEEQKAPIPTQPILFAKAANATIGPEEEIIIPRWASEQIDHEVELAVVIAKTAYRVPRTEAHAYIFGYTVFNDVTARDIQKGDRQWFRGKSFATFAPTGPVIVTPDEFDSSNAALTLKVNGDVRQRGTTSDLIFDVPALIEFASSCFTLEPGDVIATGTPSGVGMYRTPPLWLKPRDRVEAEITGIGILVNTVR